MFATPISLPINLSILEKSNSATALEGISPSNLTISPHTLAPERRDNNIAALFKANSTLSGSAPLSKRNEASVLRLWRFELFLTETGLKKALSINTFVVEAVTPDSSPPKTPAIHIGFVALQIIRSSALRTRSAWSSVTNFSPSNALLTTTLPPSILL
ncbi:hypothetical protein SDC9_147745 [bioreactor metagenome]|uniref:Uncharacterized protein n=1 Tax=bioreactor metagenome TaxID=1076179 RepID=A0A645EHB9_9ZZZZ